jgi:tetratricopeptide (TPR) repeat protein
MPSGQFIARYFLAAFALVAGSSAGTIENLQDPARNPGFVYFLNNEYDQALVYFEDQVKANPDDSKQYNHVAQTILYRELFRNGALESQLVGSSNAFLKRPKLEMAAADRQHFRDCIRKAIAMNEACLRSNPRDVKALYELGVAHGLQANYLFLMEKSWVESLREASTARKLQERVLEMDPQFVDARLILGVYQYAIGCLPFYMRALGFVGGFHGSKEGGLRQLQLVASNGVLNRYDAKVLLAVLYRREHEPQQAIPLLQELSRQFDHNYLFRFEQVQMYSDLGDKASAFAVLADIEKRRRAGAPGYETLRAEKVQYVTGNLHFRYGDLDSALQDLKQATGHPDELDSSTAVIAWLRLGQVYDLQGDRQQAISAYRTSMKIAPASGIAEEAKGYINNPYKKKAKGDRKG